MKILLKKACLFFTLSFSLSASLARGECPSPLPQTYPPLALSQVHATPIVRLHFGPGPDGAGVMKSQASVPPHLHSRTHGSSHAKGLSLSKVVNSKTTNFRTKQIMRKQINRGAPVSAHQLRPVRLKGNSKK
ncbi:hypothetical protein [Candidatus Protochlamydia phocaeensis]|uniref:hypothetical protein n=1 Tax=Candidatus Protochlamydia phocaeensis TaxID=1414722 RepID=UPI000839152E|nr:hypothetical protein [Candidatus Protochlamydia phocaeensis]